jgi:hypothetical protein
MGAEESSFVQKGALRRAQKAAWKEVRWFYETMRGRVPEKADVPEWEYVAAQRIDHWLRTLPTFHSGAFALRYTPRTWPPAVAKCFGSSAALVVRIECAQHPSDGSVGDDELEKASIARLEELIEGKRTKTKLYDLVCRAYWHLRAAHKAYVKARGIEPCVLAPEVEKELPSEGSDE